MSKLPTFKYKFANNKEINRNNTKVIVDFRKSNDENIVRLQLSSISLKYKEHLNAIHKCDFTKLISKYIEENITINKPLVVNQNDDDTYNLILGYKYFIIANGIEQSEINAIVVKNESRNSFLRSIGYNFNYITLGITNLKVPEIFSSKVVNQRKLKSIKKYYDNHHTLDKPVTITKDGVIIDGYARYILAKDLGLETIECVQLSRTFEEVSDNA